MDASTARAVDDDDRDSPLEDQRPQGCPTCGAREHAHRRTTPVHPDCARSFGRAVLVKLRGRAA